MVVKAILFHVYLNFLNQIELSFFFQSLLIINIILKLFMFIITNIFQLILHLSQPQTRYYLLLLQLPTSILFLFLCQENSIDYQEYQIFYQSIIFSIIHSELLSGFCEVFQVIHQLYTLFPSQQLSLFYYMELFELSQLL